VENKFYAEIVPTILDWTKQQLSASN
jgi:hypothetical protein